MNPATVLIVDSEATIRKLLGLALAKAGYEVRAASRPDEALKILSDNRIDLVLADVGWPEMSGHDLARTVAVRCPLTRVVLMSGWHSDCEDCPYVSRCKTIRKPFKVEDVLTEIAASLAKPAN